MRKAILLLSFIFLGMLCHSQEEDSFLPVSWTTDLKEQVEILVLPELDLTEVAQEDEINDKDKSLPWRYGISREIQLDAAKDGVWSTLPSGSRIWRVAVQSPRAINLSINFNDFYIPDGARVHFYNQDRTDVSKTYSSSENRMNNKLGSWFVSGDIIWVEYFEPVATRGNPAFKVGSIIHGYRMGLVNSIINTDRGLNDSGDCNYDVNCSIGADFDTQKDLLKKTVALLNLGNGYLCSASLINNTAGDKKPYLLTGNHCLENSDPSFWSVRFNWSSPNPVCGTEDDSSDISSNFTMSGAELRASNERSDFALVELFNGIPLSWDVAFAGWDRSDDLPIFEVGIHHPNGDIMKISRDNTGAVQETANGTEVWLIGGTTAGTGDGWEIGTTESGSSGSPLFNENGHIIGQLYAGLSACDGTEDNNDYDIYGRFGISWDEGNSAETRLSDWLDPVGSGQLTSETLQNILNIEDIEFLGNLSVYPNPASDQITVMNGKFPSLIFGLYTLLGQEVRSGFLRNTENSISVQDLSNGVYLLRLIDEVTQDEITKKIVIQR